MSFTDRFRAGVVTSGKLVVLGVESTSTAVSDIARGRFSWSEFLLQAWFMTKVSLLPTILVAIPFGVITSVQIGAVASQIGAGSFSGAINGIGVLRQGAPLVTSLMIAGAVGSATAFFALPMRRRFLLNRGIKVAGNCASHGLGCRP